MRRVLSIGVLAAIAVLAAIGTPAHAEDTGGIAGRYTENGAPVVRALVSVRPEFGGGGTSAYTDDNGSYRIEGLAPGRYRVGFLTDDGLTQYAFGKTSYSDATLITVTAGAVSTVDDSRLPTGAIDGTFAGPVPDPLVTFLPEAGSGGQHHVMWAYDGRFSARLFAGRYKVSFGIHSQDAGSYVQYAGGTDVSPEATVFDVTPGGTVSVSETMLPTGRVQGRFTDAAGNGMPNVEVTISRPGGGGSADTTDAGGNYTFPYARTSSQWRVRFHSHAQGFSQYAYGELHEADADPITVTQGQTTVVNDSRLATGTVRVRVKEAVTGAGVDKFQANLGEAGFGSTKNGELLMQDIPAGTHSVSIWAYGYEYAAGAATVTVTPGAQSDVAIELRPITRIEALAVDAATGRPVENVCLVPVRPQRFVLPGEHCGDETTSGPSGRAMVEINQPGSFHLMAFPMGAQGLGAQWVGPSGGTGSQLGAQLVTVEAGQSAKAPTIKLDRAGTITGQVTSPSGTPVPRAVVSLGEWSATGPGVGVYDADAQGRYRIGNLGPYHWPLRFYDALALGIQWSGQAATRHAAQPVVVRSGQSTGYDFRYRTPVQLRTNPGVAKTCLIEAFNLLTGDLAATMWADDCSQPVTLPVIGPQWLKVRVSYSGDGEWVERFYQIRFARPGELQHGVVRRSGG